MKNMYICFALFLLPLIQVKAQTPADTTQGAVITFETIVIDYGTVDYNADGNREFTFKNTGNEPLIITDVIRGCGCTTPSVPKDPVKPGETGVIKVHYDTKRAGAFEKTLTVTSNAANGTVILKIKGTVKPNTNTSGTTAPQQK
ncbi:MAG: DUF1573 domain-containing protein [Bacteroidota bacterium]